MHTHMYTHTCTGDSLLVGMPTCHFFSMFWGSPAQISSLCNMREVIRRLQVDKGVKIFNIGDEFLLHVFKAHFKVSISPFLNVKTSAGMSHQTSQEWLHDIAEKIVSNVLVAMPSPSTDPVYNFHKNLLHHIYMYIDLREAIGRENGPQIAKHWKWWLPRFLAAGCRNYAAVSQSHC